MFDVLLFCLLLQSSQHTDSRGTAVLSDRSRKRTADEESSEDNDDIWDKMDVVTSTSKPKRLQKSKSICFLLSEREGRTGRKSPELRTRMTEDIGLRVRS